MSTAADRRIELLDSKPDLPSAASPLRTSEEPVRRAFPPRTPDAGGDSISSGALAEPIQTGLGQAPDERPARGVSLRGGIVRVLGFYHRWLSPLLPPLCRFYPSCSVYAAQAIEKHGILEGGRLAAVRLCKCHPLHPGGFDPVR
jgi:putative membrane protein insertion efficiency factor